MCDDTYLQKVLIPVRGPFLVLIQIFLDISHQCPRFFLGDILMFEVLSRRLVPLPEVLS